MALKTTVKNSLKRLGLYPMARHWYRRVDTESRKTRADERVFYRQFVEEGDLCFDIGANLGRDGQGADRFCGAKIVSVEPNPYCVDLLKWAYGHHPSVTIVEKAIGSISGFADLHFEGTDSTGSLRSDWPYAGKSVRRVELTTLDELIAKFGMPKLCKIDVEGYELEVFKGLSQPIPIICFEFYRPELPRAINCLARLAEIGEITSANVTDSDAFPSFRNDWMSRDDLVAQISSTGYVGGNIVVKMK